jgi:hypothetical protein
MGPSGGLAQAAARGVRRSLPREPGRCAKPRRAGKRRLVARAAALVGASREFGEVPRADQVVGVDVVLQLAADESPQGFCFDLISPLALQWAALLRAELRPLVRVRAHQDFEIAGAVSSQWERYVVLDEDSVEMNSLSCRTPGISQASVVVGVSHSLPVTSNWRCSAYVTGSETTSALHTFGALVSLAAPTTYLCTGLDDVLPCLGSPGSPGVHVHARWQIGHSVLSLSPAQRESLCGRRNIFVAPVLEELHPSRYRSFASAARATFTDGHELALSISTGLWRRQVSRLGEVLDVAVIGC